MTTTALAKAASQMKLLYIKQWNIKCIIFKVRLGKNGKVVNNKFPFEKLIFKSERYLNSDFMQYRTKLISKCTQYSKYQDPNFNNTVTNNNFPLSIRVYKIQIKIHNFRRYSTVLLMNDELFDGWRKTTQTLRTCTSVKWKWLYRYG